MTQSDSQIADAAAIRVDRPSGGRYKRESPQERGRGQVVEHPAPPLSTTVRPVVAMFPASILATLAAACTTDFCPEVPPVK
jgi:hypothetical protein